VQKSILFICMYSLNMLKIMGGPLNKWYINAVTNTCCVKN